MKRKALAFLLASLMSVGAFTGCASTPPAADGGQTDPAGQEAASEQPAQETQAAATSISYWMTPPGEEATRLWWEKWLGEYNAGNTDNVTVDLQFVPEDAFDSKLKAAQATGTAPQLSYVNHASAIKGAAQSLYLPLNDYIDMSKLDDVYQNIRDMITVDGKIYSVPMYVEPYSVLFYRKDLFTAAGLDPEAPPKTWDELLTYAKALTNDGTFGLGIAGSADAGWTNWGWQAALGMTFINDDWSAATVNNEITKDYLTFTKSLYDSEVVPKQPLAAFWDIQPLVDGRVAMQFNGSWAISRILVDFKDTIDPANIGIALPPTRNGLESGDTVGALGGYALAIDGKAQNPKEVGNFISYLLLGDPQIMAEFVSGNYFAKYSVRQSVDDALGAESENKIDEWFNLFTQDVTPFSQPEPIYPWEVDTAFVAAMDNVIVNGMPADEALAQCEQEINDYIQNNGTAGTNPRNK